MKIAKRITRSALAAAAALAAVSPAFAQDAFRPPAVPLVTSDPYLSIWSTANRLTDDVTRHWTGRPHSLVSMIRVDGHPYRLMGMEPVGVPALPQVKVDVLPTRSIYEFQDSRVDVTLTFLTPALPSDLDVLTRPLTYLTWTVRSVDGKPHDVSIYDGTSSQISVNEPGQQVTWLREKHDGIVALHAGTVEQNVLASGGDDHRIDWGYVYAAAPAASATAAIAGESELESAFVEGDALPTAVDTDMPRASNVDEPTLGLDFDLGHVGGEPVSTHAMIAYDEIYSIDYFGRKLRPYWRRNGDDAFAMLEKAEADYPALTRRCAAFDGNLMSDLTKVGGAKYAQIAALAYRQCIAATGIAADANGKPLLFTKENTSNGDIATVDVIFPMDPIWVFLSPTLAKASLVPDLSYAASDHWKFPNAPHDLGTYPRAYGTDDGGEGMPVEESGNMIILCDAIAKDDGNADFVSPWWPKIAQWAQYLEKYGLDPEDQLCTDDFMGHLAHNSNLSIKAIVALGAFADLCKMRGDNDDAAHFRAEAEADAKHWVEVADQGGHSDLAFDKPGTWSQKYNLVWDRILGLDLFPQSVADQEVAYYKSVMQPYGVPLDSRTHLTKSDWSMWAATMASNRDDFETLVSPIYAYLTTTTAREPLADSYMTDDMHSGGMHARPVVGGMFIKMLSDPDVWRKWSSMDKMQVAGWAGLPAKPTITEVVPSSLHAPQMWRYTVDKPAGDWMKPAFDDSAWPTGSGGFGTDGTPNAVVGTTWNTDDIWIRRNFTMPDSTGPGDLELMVYHDEDAEVYFNGVLAGSFPSYENEYLPKPINKSALALLTPGAHIELAVHCHQTTGGQGIDVGIARVYQPG